MAIGPLGVFDSGVGGLTVVEEIYRQLPETGIIYFGDTAHVPYGPRPVEELIGYADDITAYLISEGAKVIIDACNSTSSVALDFLQAKYPLPVVGVVEPGVRAALQVTRNGNIGIIATEATVKSGAHKRLIEQVNKGYRVYGKACPLFVPLIEAGEVQSETTRRVALEYLTPLIKNKIDTLILGCTHYPFLRHVLEEILGPEVILVDPARETVLEAKKALQDLGLPEDPNHKRDKFYVSGDPATFQKLGSKLSKCVKLDVVEKVSLE